MSVMPGWDSIESTGWWSHFWFWFGIVCLFLLAASEVVSHIYSLRKDDLVTAAESRAQDQRKQDAEAAETRRKADVGALQRDLADAGKKIAEFERLSKPRTVTDEQRAKLTAFLSDKPKGKLIIYPNSPVPDAKAYGGEIAAVFRLAGWTVEELDAMIFGNDLTGLWMAIRDRDNPPQALYVAHTALLEAGIAIRKEVNVEQIVPEGEAVALKIGFNK